MVRWGGLIYFDECLGHAFEFFVHDFVAEFAEVGEAELHEGFEVFAAGLDETGDVTRQLHRFISVHRGGEVFFDLHVFVFDEVGLLFEVEGVVVGGFAGGLVGFDVGGEDFFVAALVEEVLGVFGVGVGLVGEEVESRQVVIFDVDDEVFLDAVEDADEHDVHAVVTFGDVEGFGGLVGEGLKLFGDEFDVVENDGHGDKVVA